MSQVLNARRSPIHFNSGRVVRDSQLNCHSISGFDRRPERASLERCALQRFLDFTLLLAAVPLCTTAGLTLRPTRPAPTASHHNGIYSTVQYSIIIQSAEELSHLDFK